MKKKKNKSREKALSQNAIRVKSKGEKKMPRRKRQKLITLILKSKYILATAGVILVIITAIIMIYITSKANP
jgi:ATP/ADP translocase